MSSRFSMRDLVADDSATLLRWRNLPDVRSYMYTDVPIQAAEHERWFAGIAGDDTRRYWVIQLDGEDVGLVNLYGISKQHKRCYWAFYLASPSVRGKGVGAAVEHFILNNVFERQHFAKLCCEVLETNEAVVSMHKGFGFVQEGLFRSHVERSDGRHNVVSLSMLRGEWVREKPRIEARLREKGVLK